MTPVPFSGSYAPADVEFLLTPVALRPIDVERKERLIQSGRRHYSEMLSAEAPPSAAYMALYRDALEGNGPRLGREIASLAGALAARARDGTVVLVSLARAGTPIGVLLRRALVRLGLEAPHYSISIIRDRGLDRRALDHITASHDRRDLVFVDGWTGKGVIAGELRRACAGLPEPLAPFLAVVADPAGQADLAATAEDYAIPSGLLNGVVSGLVSRSVLNAEVEAAGRFHGCRLLPELAAHDVSRAFVDQIDAHAARASGRLQAGASWSPDRRRALAEASATLVERMLVETGAGDRNRIKPGVAEAARAVLRRVPERLFLSDADDPDLRPLAHLARSKGLACEPLTDPGAYKAVAVIRSLGAE